VLVELLPEEDVPIISSLMHTSVNLLRAKEASVTRTVGGAAFVIPIHQAPGGASFAIKLHPRAKKNAVTGEIGDALKVAVTAPPIEGRANEACIEFLANTLKVPRSSVSIVSGETSRTKVIRVTGLSREELRKRLLADGVLAVGS
jgi:uncharacterized protein